MVKTKNKPEKPVEEKPEEKTEENSRDTKGPQLSGLDISQFVDVKVDPNENIMKEILTIPVLAKPNKQSFFRTHPEFETKAYIIEWEDERNAAYIVLPKMLPYVDDQAKPYILYLCTYPNGTIFLTSIKQPNEDGNWNEWHRSKTEAIIKAKKEWIRLIPDKKAQGYNVQIAKGDYGVPKWPELSMNEIIAIAFKDRHISDVNHPKIKQLAGLQ